MLDELKMIPPHYRRTQIARAISCAVEIHSVSPDTAKWERILMKP